eukprot:TRINITY_DN7882_c2_g1_i1.p1 TRINITY_DN7882_c2_g1~~TRINITY_DN7882_c2_g1_i1.p1  ORF type:complete len:353 (+),score=27.70 TRINITY_DN7882_c2_g1_i1:61-1059(+)
MGVKSFYKWFTKAVKREVSVVSNPACLVSHVIEWLCVVTVWVCQVGDNLLGRFGIGIAISFFRKMEVFTTRRTEWEGSADKFWTRAAAILLVPLTLAKIFRVLLLFIWCALCCTCAMAPAVIVMTASARLFSRRVPYAHSLVKVGCFLWAVWSLFLISLVIVPWIMVFSLPYVVVNTIYEVMKVDPKGLSVAFASVRLLIELFSLLTSLPKVVLDDPPENLMKTSECCLMRRCSFMISTWLRSIPPRYLSPTQLLRNQLYAVRHTCSFPPEINTLIFSFVAGTPQASVLCYERPNPFSPILYKIHPAKIWPDSVLRRKKQAYHMQRKMLLQR